MLSSGFHLLKKFSSQEYQKGRTNWFSDGTKKLKIGALSEASRQVGSAKIP
jgi:hypothetical protein